MTALPNGEELVTWHCLLGVGVLDTPHILAQECLLNQLSKRGHLFKFNFFVHILIRPGAARHATPIVDTGGLFTIVEVYCFGAFIYLISAQRFEEGGDLGGVPRTYSV